MDYLATGLKEKIELLISNKLFETHTSIPAVIERVDYTRQRLDAKIAINAVADVGGKDVAIEYPTLRGIPFFTLQSGDFFVTVPPKIGDTCILIFCERNADNFWDTGKVSAPAYAKSRKHNINDAVAIVGFNPAGNTIPNYKTDRIQIRDRSGNDRIDLTDHSITVESCTSVIYLTDDKILVKRKDNDSGLEINANAIAIIRGGSRITLTNDGILLDTDTYLTIGAKEIEVVSDGDLSIGAGKKLYLRGYDGVEIVSANGSISGTANDIGFDAKNDIAMSANGVNITSAVHITGDLDVNAVKFKPVKDGRRGEGDPTPGYLYTGYLDTFIDFVAKLKDQDANFHIVVKDDELDIFIANEEFKSDDPGRAAEITSYEGLAEAITLQSGGMFVCTVEEYEVGEVYEYRLVFETAATGIQDGYISFLKNIEEHSGDTHGILQTGALGDWGDFKASLNEKGLAFKINVGGEHSVFGISFEKVDECEGFEAFAELLNGMRSDILAVQYAGTQNILIFATVRVGAFDGYIDYMQDTDTGASPAQFESGKIEVSWSDFLTRVEDKACALKTRINGEEYTFRIMNEDIHSCSGLGTFFEKFFNHEDIEVSFYFGNSLVIETKLRGSGASLDYFSDVSHLPAENAYLITGSLPSFNSIKSMYASQTLSIEFYLEVGADESSLVKYDFLITPEDLTNAVTWHDIADNLSKTSFGKVEYNEAGVFVFTYGKAGLTKLSYMQHTPDTEELQTIDGSALLAGTEKLAYQKYDGADEVRDIFPTADLFKLTAATGAEVTRGSDDEYNSGSADLIKGTEDTGAHVYPGEDGEIEVINNTADLLKGTAALGAKLIPATDGGEVPEPYDGIITIVGDLHVTNELQSRVCTVFNELTATGVIEFNPVDIETKKIGEVVVKGGISGQWANISGLTKTDSLEVKTTAKVQDLTVFNIANIKQLVVNNGVHITGDLVIDNGSIKANGTTISFGLLGVTFSSNIYTPDTYVNS